MCMSCTQEKLPPPGAVLEQGGGVIPGGVISHSPLRLIAIILNTQNCNYDIFIKNYRTMSRLFEPSLCMGKKK